MNRLLLLGLALAALNVSLVCAQEPATAQPYVDFLNQNVINRTVSKAGEGKSTDGKRSYSYQRDMTFCNLFRSGTTLQFDNISIIKQRSWKLDPQGERVGSEQSRDRMLVTRYQVRYKQATNSLVGFSNIITSTIDNGSASANEVTLRLDDNALVLRERTVGFDDAEDADGQLYERVSETTKKLSLKNDQLVVSTLQSKTIRLNPTTEAIIETTEDKLPEDDVQSAVLAR